MRNKYKGHSFCLIILGLSNILFGQIKPGTYMRPQNSGDWLSSTKIILKDNHKFKLTDNKKCPVDSVRGTTKLPATSFNSEISAWYTKGKWQIKNDTLFLFYKARVHGINQYADAIKKFKVKNDTLVDVIPKWSGYSWGLFVLKKE